MTFGRLAIVLASTTSVAVLAQAPTQPDWTKLEDETMRHYQAVLRIDTRNPPGNEHVVAEYVKGVLDKEGIPAQIVGSDPEPPQPDRAAEGQRQEAAAPDHGPQRHRHHRRSEMDATRRSARRATAATSTAAAPSTTRTTSPRR